jgi:hypothetical protein
MAAGREQPLERLRERGLGGVQLERLHNSRPAAVTDHYGLLRRQETMFALFLSFFISCSPARFSLGRGYSRLVELIRATQHEYSHGLGRTLDPSRPTLCFGIALETLGERLAARLGRREIKLQLNTS